MLEIRLTAEPKRIAAMAEAVRRECEHSNADAEHAARVVRVIEGLVVTNSGPERRTRHVRRVSGDVFVIVTVQSDCTMLIVRDTRPERGGLGDERHRVLVEETCGWSTIVGRDGRTVWAEVSRNPAPPTTAAGSAPVEGKRGETGALPSPARAAACVKSPTQATVTESAHRTTPPLVISA